MRKLSIVVVLLTVVAGAFLALRSKRSPAADLSAGEDPESAAGIARSGPSMERRVAERSSRVKLSRELLELTAKAAEEAQKPFAWAARARDRYYEKLFATTGRDREKEGELLSKLMEIFSDKPDASVGEIACNSEFCRAELLGSGQFDLMKRYGRTFASALDAKGFRFFLTDNADPGNPKVSFYFGRSASWTVPDFSRLEL